MIYSSASDCSTRFGKVRQRQATAAVTADPEIPSLTTVTGVSTLSPI